MGGVGGQKLSWCVVCAFVKLRTLNIHMYKVSILTIQFSFIACIIGITYKGNDNTRSYYCNVVWIQSQNDCCMY